MTQIRKNIADYNNLYQVSNMKYTVYIIRHIGTGSVLYVGKTKNFKKRVYQHLSLHTSTKKWLSVIGTGNVFIEAVAKFDNEVDALKYEDELILKYNTIENGYNHNRSGLIKVENPEEYDRKRKKTEKYRKSRREYDRERPKRFTDSYRRGFPTSQQADYRLPEKGRIRASYCDHQWKRGLGQADGDERRGQCKG